MAWEIFDSEPLSAAVGSFMMTLMGLFYRRELDSTVVGRSNDRLVDGLPEAGQQRPGDGGGGMKEHGQRTTRAICSSGAIRWMTMAGRNTGSRRGRPACRRKCHASDGRRWNVVRGPQGGTRDKN
jgi:hypothetical protein